MYFECACAFICYTHSWNSFYMIFEIQYIIKIYAINCTIYWLQITALDTNYCACAYNFNLWSEYLENHPSDFHEIMTVNWNGPSECFVLVTKRWKKIVSFRMHFLLALNGKCPNEIHKHFVMRREGISVFAIGNVNYTELRQTSLATINFMFICTNWRSFIHENYIFKARKVFSRLLMGCRILVFYLVFTSVFYNLFSRATATLDVP